MAGVPAGVSRARIVRAPSARDDPVNRREAASRPSQGAKVRAGVVVSTYKFSGGPARPCLRHVTRARARLPATARGRGFAPGTSFSSKTRSPLESRARRHHTSLRSGTGAHPCSSRSRRPRPYAPQNLYFVLHTKRPTCHHPLPMTELRRARPQCARRRPSSSSTRAQRRLSGERPSSLRLENNLIHLYAQNSVRAERAP